MPRTAADYIRMMEHALGGAPDARLLPMDILNDAVQYIFNCAEWKFRKRPSLDVPFQKAAPATTVNIVSIVRAATLVTVVVDAAPVPAFELNDITFTIAGVTDSSFNGTSFRLESVTDPLTASWIQQGSDATSSGGTLIASNAPAFEQFVDLPPDFGELISVVTKNNAIANILLTSLEEITWRRGTPNSIAYDGLYRIGMSFPGQTTTAVNQATPRLEIWPRPTSSRGLDLSLTYRAGAIPITDPATVPNIPFKLERLLVLTCRLFAQGYEDEQLLQQPEWASEFKTMVEADGRQQTAIGPIHGGAVMINGRHSVREFQKITDPPNRQ